jgi:hypothetical protein
MSLEGTRGWVYNFGFRGAQASGAAMKLAVLTAIAITFLTSLSAMSVGYEPEPPNYSRIKRLPPAEMQKQLEVFTGTEDTWKKNTTLLNKIRNWIPYKKKTTVEEERLALSYIHARKNPRALQQLVLAIQNSQHPEIRGLMTVIRGDKALVKDSYVSPQGYDLPSLLYFFKSLEYGDTGLETKKFHAFSFAFDRLAQDVDRAFENSAALSFPMILEFESSALLRMSPITRILYIAITNDPALTLKTEVTPDGGRIISIHPFYARIVARNLDLFADQFSKKVKTLRGRLFRDPDAKQRLIDLLKYGEGLSGIFYTDERIQELSNLERRKLGTLTCAQLFN